MDFAVTVNRLRRALCGPLPGPDVQQRMAPIPRPGWTPGRSPEESRAAAGLLLLYPIDEVAHVVLTLRSSRLPSHAGQISLPGGAVEAGETIEDAALREAQEEISIEPAHVAILGRLTPLHIPVSGFVLNPVVASQPQRPQMRPADTEVDRILEVPVDALDPRAVQLRKGYREREGLWIDIPYIDIQGAMLWGATAMVLAEFAAIVFEG